MDISSFKISDIQDYFSEFEPYLNCKYGDCDHVHISTENCGVKQAVENGYISLARYDSYARIVADLTPENEKKLTSQTPLMYLNHKSSKYHNLEVKTASIFYS